MPPSEALQAWAKELQVDVRTLSRAFAALARMRAEAPEAVVPVVAQARFGATRAWITHLVQHPSGSEVDVRLRAGTASPDEHVRAQVELAIASDSGIHCEVVPQGGHGGAGAVLKRYVVVHRLPDDLHGVAFTLVPIAHAPDAMTTRVVRPRSGVIQVCNRARCRHRPMAD